MNEDHEECNFNVSLVLFDLFVCFLTLKII